MQRKIFSLLMGLSFSLIYFIQAAYGWWDEDWGNRLKLTFKNDFISSSLIDVPVLVLLDNSRVDYDSIQNGGQDIRFIDADDATELKYEIEQWNESGSSYVWVKVPQINSSSCADSIWMYYNNSSASDAQDAGNTWNNDYVGVWHLNEDATDEQTSTTHEDATANNHDGTQGGNAKVVGKIASAQEFDGDNDSIALGDHDDFSFGDGSNDTSFSISAWIYMHDRDYFRIFSKCGPNNVREYMFYTTGSGQICYHLWDYPAVNGPRIGQLYSTPLDSMQWIYVTGTYSGNEDTSGLKLYVNDEQVENTGSVYGVYVAMSNTIRHLNIGRHQSRTADGIIDEVRLSCTARDSLWVVAQYRSMMDELIEYGPGPNWWNASWGKRMKLKFNNSYLSDSLVEFPVMVLLNDSRVDYSYTEDNGADIRFIDADNITELKYEIEQWNESGSSYVWVKVPQINSSSSADSIWMYYNNSSASDAQDAGNTWNNDYVGVWHLNEDATDEQTSTTHEDATANNHDGTQGGNAKVVGKIASAQEFDGDNDSIALGDHDDFSFGDGSNDTSFSISAWIYMHDRDYFRIISKCDEGYNTNREYMFYTTSKGNICSHIWDSPTYDVQIGRFCTTPLDSMQWLYVTSTYSGHEDTTGIKIFVNDLQVEDSTVVNGTYTAMSNTIRHLNIGRHQSLSADGVIDEVRLSRTERDSLWVVSQYKSMVDLLLVYGSAEGMPKNVQQPLDFEAVKVTQITDDADLIPNPFRNEVVIRYRVALEEMWEKTEKIQINIYSINGVPVKHIEVNQSQSDTYDVLWNGTDDTGKNVDAGTYLYEVSTERNRKTGIITLVK